MVQLLTTRSVRPLGGEKFSLCQSHRKPPSAAFVRDSPGNVRHGKYSARVVLNPGDHSAYTCRAERVGAINAKGGLDEGEASESWWAGRGSCRSDGAAPTPSESD
jgi:hypothetical protein